MCPSAPLNMFTDVAFTISSGNLFQNGTIRMLKPCWRRRVLVNFESMTAKPRAGENSKNCVQSKVEKALCYFAHTDKVTIDSSTGFGKDTRHQQWYKTRRCQHAFSVRAVPYWNKLTEEIANASFMETFKFRLDARWQSLFPEVPL